MTRSVDLVVGLPSRLELDTQWSEWRELVRDVGFTRNASSWHDQLVALERALVDAEVERRLSIVTEEFERLADARGVLGRAAQARALRWAADIGVDNGVMVDHAFALQERAFLMRLAGRVERGEVSVP